MIALAHVEMVVIAVAVETAKAHATSLAKVIALSFVGLDVFLPVETLAVLHAQVHAISRHTTNINRHKYNSNMKNKLQNRREFFKQAAKKALSILGLAVMAVAAPSMLQSCKKESVNHCVDACTNACKTTCRTTCVGSCSTQCTTGCKGSCKTGCGGNCKGFCTKTGRL